MTKEFPYNLGLALSGGSAKGFMHIGVLHYLEQTGHKLDIVAGTSVGALVGGLYADGFSPFEIADLLTQKGFLGMTNFQIPKKGVFGIKSFREMLGKNLHHKRIEDMPLPLRVVATDLDRGCSHIFTQGDAVDVITASCSIPIIFNPVVIDGVYYVDGGLFKNFPVSVIRNDCKTVIGVNLQTDTKKTYRKNITAIAQRCFDFVFGQNAQLDRTYCDILIENRKGLDGISMFDLGVAPKLIKMGYDLTRQHMDGKPHFE